MYIFKLGLINLFIQNPALNNFNYFLFVSATILITAAGYIINDIYDVKTDSVNDKKLIIGKNISKKSALNWYCLCVILYWKNNFSTNFYFDNYNAVVLLKIT